MKYSALAYHQLSSYDRLKMDPHALDWEQEPAVYKDYPGKKVLDIPLEVKLEPVSLFKLFQPQEIRAQNHPPSFETLGQLLLLAQMLTGRARHANGEIWFRSIASAGALYPSELYIACSGIAGLAAGIYHYDVSKPALALIRSGNPMPVLDGDKASGTPMLTFLISAIFFRSAWKYRDRAYRYHLLDSGHLLENLLLALRAFSFAYELNIDFDDHQVNEILGVDPRREGCLALVKVPFSSPVSADTVEPLESAEGLSRYSQVAAREEMYDALRIVHQESIKVMSGQECRAGDWVRYGLIDKNSWKSIASPVPANEVYRYPEVLLHRRSKRNFITGEPMSAACLSAIISLVNDGFESCSLAAKGLSCGLLVDNVAEMEPGFYAVKSADRSLALVTAGNFLGHMSHACLDQRWLAQAAIHVLLFADLVEVEKCAGARGYREVMLVAGRLGQRLYLGATVLGLGCCGIGAFYDREASELIGMPDQVSLLYLLAVGQVKKSLHNKTK
ncbi:MAG TPA: SagB/ThcOx family dehydrogenase [Proteobacteria bacterium]|nr:SagB/ThcOx family dehydrogenase [Pseudomonadota bacterium]